MCPHCGEPLVAFELSGVEIDHCMSCRGTWLDSGELELIGELSGAAPGALRSALAEAKHRRGGRRRCPRCTARMEPIEVGCDAPIELDRCPRGDGLWFDQGELFAVMRNAEDDEERAVGEFFRDLYRSELTHAE